MKRTTPLVGKPTLTLTCSRCRLTAHPGEPGWRDLTTRAEADGTEVEMAMDLCSDCIRSTISQWLGLDADRAPATQRARQAQSAAEAAARTLQGTNAFIEASEARMQSLARETGTATSPPARKRRSGQG